MRRSGRVTTAAKNVFLRVGGTELSILDCPVQHNMDLVEQAALLASVERAVREVGRSSTFVEIGVMRGMTSAAIIWALEQLDYPSTFYGVDVNLNKKLSSWAREFAKLYVGPSGKKRVRSNFVNATSHFVSSICGDVAWVFIDGCHCQSCTRDDITWWSAKVVPAGWLVVHDTCTNHAQTSRSAQRYHGDKREIGVRKAVFECEKTGILNSFDLVLEVAGRPGPNGNNGGIQLYRKRDA